MNAKRTTSFPTEIETVRRRFEQWRKTRQVSSPIPESLWAAAVGLAGRYGVSRIAKILRVGYYALQERAAANPASIRNAPGSSLPESSRPGKGIGR